MKCQNPKCGGETIVIRTADNIRTRQCLKCKRQAETIEQWRDVAETQARQGSYFQTIISPEARAAAQAIIKRQGNGHNHDSSP